MFFYIPKSSELGKAVLNRSYFKMREILCSGMSVGISLRKLKVMLGASLMGLGCDDR